MVQQLQAYLQVAEHAQQVTVGMHQVIIKETKLSYVTWSLSYPYQQYHVIDSNENGSRIIITTRNKEVVKSCENYTIVVQPLSRTVSEKMFFQIAFKVDMCPKEYANELDDNWWDKVDYIFFHWSIYHVLRRGKLYTHMKERQMLNNYQPFMKLCTQY